MVTGARSRNCLIEFWCFSLAGRLDIDVEYVNDCKRLAKQCRLQDLIEDLEIKCKKVYEFGELPFNGCFSSLCLFFFWSGSGDHDNGRSTNGTPVAVGN